MITNNNIEDLKKKDVFKTPENYFENLTQRVMDNIPSEESNVVDINSSKSRTARLWKSLGVSGAVAAAASLAFIFYVGTSEQKCSENALASTSEAELHVNMQNDESYNEDAINYLMVNSQDVYAYLSGEDYYE